MDFKQELTNMLEQLAKLKITRRMIELKLGYAVNYIDQQISKGSNKKLNAAIKREYGHLLQNAIGDSGKSYTPQSDLNIRAYKGNILEYYEPGEVEEKKKRKLFTGELFKDSQKAMDIADDAMLPGYPPGSTIGIREITDKIITPGDVYVIERANDWLIRRLFYKNNDQKTNIFELVSDNSWKEQPGFAERRLMHPPFYVDIDTVKKLFRVTGVFKSNELISSKG